MAGDLPAGYTLDPPKGGGGDLPAGYTLDEPKSGGAFVAKELPDEQMLPRREREIRAEALKKLMVKPPGLEDRFANEMSQGLIHPIAGAKSLVEGKVNEWLGGGKPATAGEYYRGGYGASKDYIKQAEEATPGPKGIAADVGGALLGGSGGGKILGRGPQAALAGLQGFIGGASRNADSVGNAVQGGLIGAGTNAAASHMLNGLLDRLGWFKGAKKDIDLAGRGGGSQESFASGSQIFDKLDNAGIHFKPAQTAPLAADAAKRLADVGFNANMQKQLLPALGEIGGMTGQPTTWRQLRNMQEQVSKLAGEKGADPNLRRVAGELNDEINAFINTTKPVMPASSVAAGINPAQDIAEAKALWHQGSKAQKIENLSEIGTQLSPDPGRTVRENFANYRDSFKKNPKKYDPFGNNPEQLGLIDKVIEGSPMRETWGPRLDKYGNRLAAFGGLGAAGVAAGPLTGTYDVTDKTGGTVAGTILAGLALKGAGGGMRQIAAEKGAEQVSNLIRNITNGQSYVPRNALAALIAKQNLAQGGANYASSFINSGAPQP